MSETANLLRLLVNCDKEFKITHLEVHGAPAVYVSRLTGGYSRKILAAYNHSDSSSGEVMWGNDDCNVSGMPIPEGSLINIPVAATLGDGGVSGGVDVYFANETSGENGSLRVFEGA